MNEIRKRGTESEALAPDVDSFHDARVLELLRYKAVFKHIRALALIGINTPGHMAKQKHQRLSHTELLRNGKQQFLTTR